MPKLIEIRKKDGSITAFEVAKLAKSLENAFESARIKESRKKAKKAAMLVVQIIEKYFPKGVLPTVNDLQDVILQVLKRQKLEKVIKVFLEHKKQHKEKLGFRTIYGVRDDIGLSNNAILVLAKRYLLRNEEGNLIETPARMFRRVAKTVANIESRYGKAPKKIEDEFYNLLANREFLPNSPTLMNAGTSLGQLSACFVLPVEDDLRGIFNSLRDAMLIHQSGGGTGFSFTKLRPLGDIVKSTKGVASGPISFMTVYDKATDIIKQGGKRRGANMGILNINHPDIEEFIVAKKKEGVLANFNISVGISDKFIDAAEKGKEWDLINPRTKKKAKQVNAKELWEKIIQSSWECGDPGIVFLDEINRKNPTPAVGIIESTNPCLVGNTRVSTDNGLMKISELVNDTPMILTDYRVPIQVKSGNQILYLDQCESVHFPATAIWSTGVKPVFKLTTRAGYTLTATANHKFFIGKEWLQLKDIKPGEHKILLQSGSSFNWDDTLPFAVKQTFIGKNGRKYHHNFPMKWSKDLGRALGWLIGDGWLREGKNCRAGFVFAKEDFAEFFYLKKYLNSIYGREVKEAVRENGVIHFGYHGKFFVDFFKKLGVQANWKSGTKRVPESIFTAPRDAVIGFIQALFGADGTVRKHATKKSSDGVVLSSKSKQLLQDVQLLLLQFGVKSTLMNRCRKPRKELFAYKHKRQGWKTYSCDGVLFELGIYGESLAVFRKEIGVFSEKKQNKLQSIKQSYRLQKLTDVVKSIEPAGMQEVFDLTEPISHSMIANGIVAHNCGEQPLLPYESCNLGSIDVSKHVRNGKMYWEKLRKTIYLAVNFLDNVIDANKYPIEAIETATKANRKIGLGVMGFAECLARCGVAYDSQKALVFAEKLMKFIRDEAHKKSQQLGKERGNFSNFDKSIYAKKYKSMRNAAITTIAPTGSISIIADATSGIEPFFGIAFIREVMGGTKLLEVNPYFEEIAKKKGFYSKELMFKIAKQGSIQKITGIPKDIKKLFVTSFDIQPERHVKMQAVFQKYSDSAVSKTVNLPEKATQKDIEKIFKLAHKLNCKGITVYRYGSKKEQVLYVGKIKPEQFIVGEEYSGGCFTPDCLF